MLAIIGASGKLGLATLTSLVNDNLLPASSLVLTSSSDHGAAQLAPFTSAGAHLRRANWDSPAATWTAALAGCTSVFLISSARVDRDFDEAPDGEGREADHLRVLEAATEVGIKHLYYTSLAFRSPSRSRVMAAHERTEAWLAKHAESNGMAFTVLREGLYSESWPLYLGHWELERDKQARTEVLVAGDGKIHWTSIPDLGRATAVVLAGSKAEWAGKTVVLAQKQAYTLTEVAEMVSKVLKREVAVKVVGREEHEQFYVQSRGMDERQVKWWSKTYDGLREGEGETDDPTLERLLAEKGLVPTPMEETVKSMLA